MTSISTRLIARRRLKALAARTLPEALKKRVRGFLYGYRQSRVSLPVSFPPDPAGPVVVITDRIRLRFEEEDRRAVRTHFADHGAAVEEMSSFIEIAAHANTLFDVGADRGIFSLVFCGAGDGKRAVAYEPSPGRFAAAAALAALNDCDGRLTLRQAALGEIHGRAGGTLFSDGTMVPGSRDPAGTAADVEMTTVDREVEALGMVPDVMKIDVEGYEHEVLRGAQALLRTRKPILCLELHLDLLERRGIAPVELVANLQSHGYRFRSCVGRPLDPSDIADSLHAVLRFVAF
jgi:FkbM family methyltransferase